MHPSKGCAAFSFFRIILPLCHFPFMSKHADFYKENLKQIIIHSEVYLLVDQWFTVKGFKSPCSRSLEALLPPFRNNASRLWKRAFRSLEAKHHPVASKTSSGGFQNIIQRLAKYYPPESKVSSAGGQSKLVCTSKHHQTEAKTSSDEEQTNLLCRTKHD